MDYITLLFRCLQAIHHNLLSLQILLVLPHLLKEIKVNLYSICKFYEWNHIHVNTYVLSWALSGPSSSTSRSFTLVPVDTTSKNSTTILQKEGRTNGPLNKIRNREQEIRLECEWEDCNEAFDDLHAFLDHVAYHVTDVPIISTKITSEVFRSSQFPDWSWWLYSDLNIAQNTFWVLISITNRKW